MPGKYFIVKSQLNGLVLDISGGGDDPGTQVITWEEKPGGENDNQLWYEHPATGTIRSKKNDMCLTIDDDNTLVINNDGGSDNQKWKKDGDRVLNVDGDRVLDIAQRNEDPGARVCAWSDGGGSHQRWSFEHGEPRYFYIVSRMNGKVLDISGADSSEGAQVIMWPRKDDVVDNQLWYEDECDFIRSKLNDFHLDSSSDNICMQPHEDHNDCQQWMIRDEKICQCCDHNKALDIAGENDDDGAPLCCWDFKDGDNQKWDIEYV